MRGLDDILTPSTDRPILWLDAAAMAPLGVILFVWLPGWIQTGDLTDLSVQMSSPLMLIALGMGVAFRVGAIDLSGWMVAATAGLIAAALIGQNLPAELAFVIAALFGAAVGALNGLLVKVTRLPSLIITTVMAGLMLGAMSLLSFDQLALPEGAFNRWIILLPPEGPDAMSQSLPLSVTRMAIVLCIFSLMMGVLIAGKRTEVSLSRRRWVALAASGTLAGLGGACSLLDHDLAVVPSLPVGDFRPLAAALLAGTLALAGPGRTSVAAMFVPIALLAATIWQLAVPLGSAGVEWQTLLLIGGAAIVTVSVRMIRRKTTPR